MKSTSIPLLFSALFMINTAFVPASGRLISKKSHIRFFSTTPAENIEAHNVKAASTLDTKSGEIVFSVPMQSFDFEKTLMQRHFNSVKFLDTKKFPKARLVGKIINLNEVHFDRVGSYSIQVSGVLDLHGFSKPIQEMATLIVSQGSIHVNSNFNITLADYGISFIKGRPASNIAKTVEVTVEAEYSEEHP